MTIRVNGEALIRNAAAKLSSDGRILTVIARNPDRTVGDIATLLGAGAKIEVLDGAAVKAIYQGMMLVTIGMETLGGATVVTASMQVDTLDMDTADVLRQAMDLQAATIAEQEKAIAQQAKDIEELGGIIEDQALVIGTQAERITAQDKSLAAMDKTVTGMRETADAAAQTMQSLRAENEQLKEALDLLLTGETQEEVSGDGESVEAEGTGI